MSFARRRSWILVAKAWGAIFAAPPGWQKPAQDVYKRQIQSVFEDADVIYFTGGNSFFLIDPVSYTHLAGERSR